MVVSRFQNRSNKITAGISDQLLISFCVCFVFPVYADLNRQNTEHYRLKPTRPRTAELGRRLPKSEAGRTGRKGAGKGVWELGGRVPESESGSWGNVPESEAGSLEEVCRKTRLGVWR